MEATAAVESANATAAIVGENRLDNTSSLLPLLLLLQVDMQQTAAIVVGRRTG